MNKESFRRIRQFRKDETGGMTVEFVLLFPLLLVTFVYFMGYACATMRSAMILDHAQQSARAYSIGYFVDEADLKSHLDTYLWNVSAAKDVSTDKSLRPAQPSLTRLAMLPSTLTSPCCGWSLFWDTLASLNIS